MKFRILSDLHLEFYNDNYERYVKLSSEINTDYLILAGDIIDFKSINKFENFINSIKKYYKKIFYVLGNHEYYYTDNFNDIKYYKQLCEKLNVILLENEQHNINDTIILFGCTFWSSVSYDTYLQLYNPSFLEFKDIRNMHIESRNNIKNLDETKKYIIITHYLPSYKLIDKKYKNSNLNSGFASNSDDLFKNNIKFWIYGHSHTPNRTKIIETEFISNPIGYPNENYKEEDNIPDCIFELIQ